MRVSKFSGGPEDGQRSRHAAAAVTLRRNEARRAERLSLVQTVSQGKLAFDAKPRHDEA